MRGAGDDEEEYYFSFNVILSTSITTCLLLLYILHFSVGSASIDCMGSIPCYKGNSPLENIYVCESHSIWTFEHILGKGAVRGKEIEHFSCWENILKSSRLLFLFKSDASRIILPTSSLSVYEKNLRIRLSNMIFAVLECSSILRFCSFHSSPTAVNHSLIQKRWTFSRWTFRSFLIKVIGKSDFHKFSIQNICC